MSYQFLRFPEGKSKAFTMSYDDGCIYDPKFSDIISSYGLKCTFNFNCSKKLSDDVVKEKIIDRGHEIAVHGENHKAPSFTRAVEGISEVLNCRKDLEKRFGLIIRGMAYPDCGINRFTHFSDYETVKNYLKDLDIVYSRTLAGDNNSFLLPSDWYAWMPTAHHTNPKLMDYLNEFIKIDTSNNVYRAARFPRLFYLWGHSYEFNSNNNWDLLTDICEKISNRDDIWYATNMEIYNYCKAYDSLSYSADGSIVYNPSLLKIWFTRGDDLYTIDPGQTVTLPPFFQ